DLPWLVRGRALRRLRVGQRRRADGARAGHRPPGRGRARERARDRAAAGGRRGLPCPPRALAAAERLPGRGRAVDARRARRGGWVAGFLAVGGAQGGRGFTRRQLRLADGLAHHAAIALQNARLVADLEEADRLKSEFVSTMSHELRTPLNVIIGYTEMLREEAAGPVTPGQRDLIDRLDARGRELLELIEATLHVGRLEAGRDTIELKAIDLAEPV